MRHVYWDWGGKVLSHWDESSGNVNYFVSRDPAFSASANSHDFGATAALADGSVFVRVYAPTYSGSTDTTPFGYVLDAALTPGSAVPWMHKLGYNGTYQSQDYQQSGGLTDPATGLTWLAIMPADSGGLYAPTWASFDATGAEVGNGLADMFVKYGTGSRYAYTTNPCLVDGWLYRNSNNASQIERVNVTTGAWEFEFRSLWNNRAVIGYDATYGLILYDFNNAAVYGYDIASMNFVAASAYGTASTGTPTQTGTWTLTGAQSSSNWQCVVAQSGKVYYTQLDGVSGVDYGFPAAPDLPWGSEWGLYELDLATGVSTKTLAIPYGYVDYTGQLVDGNQAGYMVGDDLPEGILIVEGPDLALSGDLTDTRRRFMGA